jgi:hypothetical protein
MNVNKKKYQIRMDLRSTPTGHNAQFRNFGVSWKNEIKSNSFQAYQHQTTLKGIEIDLQLSEKRTAMSRQQHCILPPQDPYLKTQTFGNKKFV